ncbi:MAG: methyltransferase, partial [Candidatus Ancillula sp.]|nr:methyltransferase [Candidatus Ancillula sp.]
SQNGQSILDLGCGWGAISIFAAKFFKSQNLDYTISAVDVNSLAVKLANLNFKNLNIERAKAELVPSDTKLLKQNQSLKNYDLILSNPPIRIGKAELKELLSFWLGHLNTNGKAILVIQKNLGSDSIIKWINQETVWTATKLASSKGFRIIEVE